MAYTINGIDFCEAYDDAQGRMRYTINGRDVPRIDFVLTYKAARAAEAALKAQAARL